MNDDSSDDVLPTVPLDYFQRADGTWVLISRWVAWITLAYAVITVLASLPAILFYVFQAVGGTSRISFVSQQVVLLALPTIAAATVLLIGAILMISRVKIAMWIVIGAYIGLIACSALQFMLNASNYAFSGNFKQLGSGFALYQCISLFFALVRNVFVPVLILLLFFRREVRQASRG